MTDFDRRRFLKWAGIAAGSLPLIGTSACVSVPPRPKRGPSVEAILAEGARVMWIAAHPDDESLCGSILARSSLVYKNPMYFLVLTHGEGGECCRSEGCLPDLGSVRAEEMRQVARLYRAELQHERLFNASLPVESFPRRHEIAAKWKEQADPERLCAQAIRRFRPDVIFTFGPRWGFTGHPEHQLTSRFAMAGARLAANKSKDLDGLHPHRVKHAYYGLNKYWPFILMGRADPEFPTEAWKATTLCKMETECRQMMAEFTRPHRTQENDMGRVRGFTWALDKVYLRKVDPFRERLDPYEIEG